MKYSKIAPVLAVFAVCLMLGSPIAAVLTTNSTTADNNSAIASGSGLDYLSPLDGGTSGFGLIEEQMKTFVKDSDVSYNEVMVFLKKISDLTSKLNEFINGWFVGGGMIVKWSDVNPVTIVNIDDNVKTPVTIKSGETVVLNKNYTFSESGKLTFEAGSNLVLDLNFSITSTTNANIIELKKGSNIGFGGEKEAALTALPNDLRINLRNSITSVFTMPTPTATSATASLKVTLNSDIIFNDIVTVSGKANEPAIDVNLTISIKNAEAFAKAFVLIMDGKYIEGMKELLNNAGAKITGEAKDNFATISISNLPYKYFNIKDTNTILVSAEDGVKLTTKDASMDFGTDSKKSKITNDFSFIITKENLASFINNYKEEDPLTHIPIFEMKSSQKMSDFEDGGFKLKGLEGLCTISTDSNKNATAKVDLKSGGLSYKLGDLYFEVGNITANANISITNKTVASSSKLSDVVQEAKVVLTTKIDNVKFGGKAVPIGDAYFLMENINLDVTSTTTIVKEGEKAPVNIDIKASFGKFETKMNNISFLIKDSTAHIAVDVNKESNAVITYEDKTGEINFSLKSKGTAYNFNCKNTDSKIVLKGDLNEILSVIMRKDFTPETLLKFYDMENSKISMKEFTLDMNDGSAKTVLKHNNINVTIVKHGNNNDLTDVHLHMQGDVYLSCDPKVGMYSHFCCDLKGAFVDYSVEKKNVISLKATAMKADHTLYANNVTGTFDAKNIELTYSTADSKPVVEIAKGDEIVFKNFNLNALFENLKFGKDVTSIKFDGAVFVNGEVVINTPVEKVSGMLNVVGGADSHLKAGDSYDLVFNGDVLYHLDKEYPVNDGKSRNWYGYTANVDFGKNAVKLIPMFNNGCNAIEAQKETPAAGTFPYTVGQEVVDGKTVTVATLTPIEGKLVGTVKAKVACGTYSFDLGNTKATVAAGSEYVLPDYSAEKSIFAIYIEGKYYGSKEKFIMPSHDVKAKYVYKSTVRTSALGYSTDAAAMIVNGAEVKKFVDQYPDKPINFMTKNGTLILSAADALKGVSVGFEIVDSDSASPSQANAMKKGNQSHIISINAYNDEGAKIEGFSGNASVKITVPMKDGFSKEDVVFSAIDSYGRAYNLVNGEDFKVEITKDGKLCEITANITHLSDYGVSFVKQSSPSNNNTLIIVLIVVVIVLILAIAGFAIYKKKNA